MSELISRQAVIDAVKGRFSMPVDNLIVEVIGELPSAQPKQTCKYWDSESNFCTLHRPSAQPEQRWIPVTERLPKIGEKVLVSTKYTVFTQVFKRIYGTPDRWGWEHNTIKKVSAWMPLPEPWKGEQK